jgi:peroxiredoxin
MQRHFRSMLVNVPHMNGDPSWKLPLPATLVVATDGRIRYAKAYADHRLRPDPEAVLAALPAIVASR